MRRRGEPRARAPGCSRACSRMLACGLCAIGCREAGVPVDHAGAARGVCPATCFHPRGVWCAVRWGRGGLGRGLASAGCVRDCGQCCTRQVKLQRRVAEPMRCAWFKRAWHALCSIQHHCATGRRNGNAKTEAVVRGRAAGAGPTSCGRARRTECVWSSRRADAGAEELRKGAAAGGRGGLKRACEGWGEGGARREEEAAGARRGCPLVD